MPSFDDVISTLLRVCETTQDFGNQVARACVVRDLRGRVRLVLEIRGSGGSPGALVRDLEQALERELRGYFAAPILVTVGGSSEQHRLAKNILDRVQGQDWPDVWPAEYSDLLGNTTRIDRKRWCVFQRFLSKESWLSPQAVGPPWSLEEGPPIVAFYSFKGGVGRTSLVAIMAWHLARAGKRVAVLDLDLEAPGVGTLLGAETTRGIIDFIVDHVAAGSNDIDGCFGEARSLGGRDGARISVFPAGHLNWSFLEKLARLDFAASSLHPGDKSPVAAALGVLLNIIRGKQKPDYILIDSRAGLHDLGGLSLHALSHVDVLVSRASEQSYQGLALTLQALMRRKRLDDFRCIIVHSFAPLPAESEIGSQERSEFLDRVYTQFASHVYAEMEGDDPQVEDTEAQHFPRAIGQYGAIERISRLEPSLEGTVFSSDFTDLCHRIEELCRVEVGSDTEDAEATEEADENAMDS